MCRVSRIGYDEDIIDRWSHRAVSLQGTLLRCSQRTQKKNKEIAELSMAHDCFMKIYLERVSLCPLQSRSKISSREACSSDNVPRSVDNIPRMNLSKNIKYLNDMKGSNHDLYNHRGYIISINNCQSDENYVSWEFYISTNNTKNYWIETLETTRMISENAENLKLNFYCDLLDRLHKMVETRDRYYLLKIYKKCFLGSEFVRAICDILNCNIEESIKIGNMMLSFGFISHVKQEHELLNDFLFYIFCENNMNNLLSKSTKFNKKSTTGLNNLIAPSSKKKSTQMTTNIQKNKRKN